MASFLDQQSHDQWLKNKFPTVSNRIHGFEVGDYISTDTGQKIDFYPVIDSTNNISGALVFRVIVKLTNDPLPERIEKFSEQEMSIIGSAAPNNPTYQVVIIQVDADLNTLAIGHYPMTSFRM